MTATASSNYDYTSAQCLEATLTNAISAPPVTVVSWVIREVAASTQAGIGSLIRTSSQTSALFCNAAGSANYYVRGSITNTILPTAGIEGTGWRFVSGVSRSQSDHESYLDGVSKNTSSVDVGTWGTGLTKGFQGCWYTKTDQTWHGNAAFFAGYNRALSINEINEVYRNPFAVPSGLIWMPNLLVSGSVVGDYNDLSIEKDDPTAGVVPTSSSISGPPIHFFAGGM
jgi:hypothetical protein